MDTTILRSINQPSLANKIWKGTQKEDSANEEKKMSFVSYPCLSRKSMMDWLHRVYRSPNMSPLPTISGHLTLQLADRVFGPNGLQVVFQNLQEMPFDAQADALIMCLSCMEEVQQSERTRLLKDRELETCCAAANDFYNMSSECDALIANIRFSSKDQARIQEALQCLERQYAKDAVHAVLELNAHVFRVVEELFGDKLFSDEWEETVDCEVITQMVDTMKDFLDVLSIHLAEKILLQHLVESMIRSSINFYIKHLLIKAEEKQEKGRKTKPDPPIDPWADEDDIIRANIHPCCFKHGDRAIYFIHGDVAVLRDFFNGVVDDETHSELLEATIEKEFDIMNCIFGLLLIASSEGDVSTIQVHLPAILSAANNNVEACRYLIGDLFHLVAPDRECDACQVVDENSTNVQTIKQTEDCKWFDYYDKKEYGQHGEILDLETMIVQRIEASQRRRPGLLERFNQSMGVLAGSWTHT